MSNNKQSSVEWFAQQLYETLEIKGDGYVIDSLLDLAKAMHKEEIERAHYEGSVIVISKPDDDMLQLSQQYYIEIFGE